MPDEEKREKLAAEREAWLPKKWNHPGSRYGTAREDRPDLAPETEPAVVAEVDPEDVPPGHAGELPENEGEDPADVDPKPERAGGIGKPVEPRQPPRYREPRG